VAGLVFCRGCGAQIHETASACPKCGAPQGLPKFEQRPQTFMGAVANSLHRYGRFSGRSTRAEYWYFILFTFLVALVAGFAEGIFLGGSQIISTIVNLALLPPSLAIQVRRLHDLDRVGWWWWLTVVPIVGWLILLIWNCTHGTRAENRFGPDPVSVQFVRVASDGQFV
jgi:uncharacterized membrane protein YhaH (DUF805 family)